MTHAIYKTYSKYGGLIYLVFSESQKNHLSAEYFHVMDIDIPETTKEEESAMAVKAIDLEIDKARAEVDKLVDAKQKLLCITVY
jgi:hypothetical protein